MYCLHITYLLSVKGFLGGQERVNFCWVFLFSFLFLKDVYPDVFSPMLIFLTIFCLLYNKNSGTNVYTAKGKNTYPPNSCVDCCHPDKALEPPNAMVRQLSQSQSNRLLPPAHSQLLISTLATTVSMISVLLIVVVSFFGTKSQIVKQEQK